MNKFVLGLVHSFKDSASKAEVNRCKKDRTNSKTKVIRSIISSGAANLEGSHSKGVKLS